MAAGLWAETRRGSGSEAKLRVLNRTAPAVDAASAQEAAQPGAQWGGRQNPAIQNTRPSGGSQAPAQAPRSGGEWQRFGEPNTGAGRSSVGGAPRGEGLATQPRSNGQESGRPGSMRISPPVVHERPSTPGYNAPRQSAPSYNAPRQSAPSYSAPRQSAPSYSAPRSGGGGGGGRPSGGGGGHSNSGGGNHHR